MNRDKLVLIALINAIAIELCLLVDKQLAINLRDQQGQ